jgi:Ankyrin repeats (3 copies)
MLSPKDLDTRFRDAVFAIDAGDLATLTRLLHDTPELASARLNRPGRWLLDTFGGKLPDFFAKPYLLWFVAEDPVRAGTLPANITDAARIIISTAQRHAPGTVQEQLDQCLRLVAWSWIARDAGVQISLIDVLVDAGAAVKGRPDDALVNRNMAAAGHLIARGAPLTLAVAACLGWWHDVTRLGATARDGELQFALVLAALNGNADALSALLAIGADINRHAAELYAHASPLHHAVSSGSLAAVQTLVAAGANVHAVDTAWSGTPLGWAQHYVEEPSPSDTHAHSRRAIYEYLKSVLASA